MGALDALRAQPRFAPRLPRLERAAAAILRRRAIAGGSRTLTGGGNGEAERIPGQSVTWQFFDLLGIRPIAGATFTADDAATGGRWWCSASAGFHAKRVLTLQVGLPLTRYGVRKSCWRSINRWNAKRRRSAASSAQPSERERAVEIYVPIAQQPWFPPAFAVQTARDPMSVLPAVKAAIARIDKDQPVTPIRTMDEVAAEATSQPRFGAKLVGLFAVLALALAAVGIFGVLAFSVGQRAREFGIRVALGAQSRDVLRLVLGGALKMTGGGIAIGLAAAAVLTRLLGTLLFNVQPTDRSRSSERQPCSASLR